MEEYNCENVVFKKVKALKLDEIEEKVIVTKETIEDRKRKLLDNMIANQLDCIVVYADLEHGSNFEYLSGFLPRFEEALLMLRKDGSITYFLGNENLKLASSALSTGDVIHVPYFSLPNQPMHDAPNFKTILLQSRIREHDQIGLVGWKLFTGNKENSMHLFDIPHFIVQGFKELLNNESQVINATSLFIGCEGVRTINNANEIVHYAYGAQLASRAILMAMDAVEVGKSEMELASALEIFGQPKSVVTICASGPRFKNANLYPTMNTLKLNDTLSLTVGYKGGLHSRSGYVCEAIDQLPQGYLEHVVKPYFNAVVAWIETIHAGMSGNDMYQRIERVLPKKIYGWSLNPGHLIANEEWMASPIYEGSSELIQSGMLFQIDIIPSVKGYAGVSVECGVAIADENLQRELTTQYPSFMKQCSVRKQYLQDQLGVTLSKDVLPLSNAVLYLRPLFLNKEYALAYKR